MAIGDFNKRISILQTQPVKDKDGFVTQKDVVVASVRAAREDKNTTEKWSNRAMFQQASALFKIRYIPNLTITTDMRIESDGEIFNITSVENVKGKNMYILLLASKEVQPHGKGESPNAG